MVGFIKVHAPAGMHGAAAGDAADRQRKPSPADRPDAVPSPADAVFGEHAAAGARRRLGLLFQARMEPLLKPSALLQDSMLSAAGASVMDLPSRGSRA